MERKIVYRIVGHTSPVNEHGFRGSDNVAHTYNPIEGRWIRADQDYGCCDIESSRYMPLYLDLAKEAGAGLVDIEVTEEVYDLDPES